MACSIFGRCSCSEVYEKYNEITGECVKRQLGDECSTDQQCQVRGHHWNGFTWDESVCSNGVCTCNKNGKQTSASYIDFGSGEVKTMEICLNKFGLTEIDKGDICTVDPVYYSDTLLVKVCQGSLVCLRCPEDDAAPFSTGFCRNVTGNIFPNLNKLSCSPTTLVPSRENTSTILTPHPNGCRSNDDCGDNQECQTVPCGPRECRCKEGYQKNEESQSCKEITEPELGDYCNGNEPISFPHMTCRGNKVSCNSYFYRKRGQCRKIEDGSFGSSCRRSGKCLKDDSPGTREQLWCDDKTKICRCYTSKSMKWDETSDTCVKREFGDPCETDDDCAVFGDINGGYTFGGGKCYKNSCICDLHRYKPVQFTYFHPKKKSLLSKFICVHQSSTINVDIGDKCTLDPIYYGNNPLGMTRVCKPGYYCGRCSNFPLNKSLNLNSFQGTCMKP